MLTEKDAAQDLPQMQKTLSGKQRLLPELSRALHLEPGILRQSRLPAADDRAARFDAFILSVFLSRNFYAVID